MPLRTTRRVRGAATLVAYTRALPRRKAVRMTASDDSVAAAALLLLLCGRLHLDRGDFAGEGVHLHLGEVAASRSHDVERPHQPSALALDLAVLDLAVGRLRQRD